MTLRYVCMRLVRQLSCLFALQSLCLCVALLILVCVLCIAVHGVHILSLSVDIATAESYRRCCEAVGPTSIFALAFIRHSDKVERFRQVSHFKKALVYLLCYLLPCLDIYCFHDQHA